MFFPVSDEENVLYCLKPVIYNRRFLCEICAKRCRSRCSDCMSAYYCSRNCQRNDWKSHKQLCPVYRKQYEYKKLQRNRRLISSKNGLLSVSVYEKMLDLSPFLTRRSVGVSSFFFHRVLMEKVHQHEFELKTPVVQVRKWLSEKMGSSSVHSFVFSDYVEDDALVEDIPICRVTGMRFISLFDWKACDILFRKQGLIHDTNYLNEKMIYHYFEIPLPAPRTKGEYIKRRREARDLFRNRLDHLFQTGIGSSRVIPFEELINLRSEGYRHLQNLLFFREKGSRESIFELLKDSPDFTNEKFDQTMIKDTVMICDLFNHLIGCCYYLDSLAEGLMLCKRSEEFIDRLSSSESARRNDVMEAIKKRLLQTHMFSAKILMMVLEFGESRKHIKLALKLSEEPAILPFLQFFKFQNNVPHPKYHLFNRSGVRKLEDDLNAMETEYLRCQQGGGATFEKDKFDYRLRWNVNNYQESSGNGDSCASRKILYNKKMGDVKRSQVRRFIAVRRIKRRYYEELMDLRSRVLFMRTKKMFFKTISLGGGREIKVLNLLFFPP